MLPNDGHGVYIGGNGGPGQYVQNNTGGCRWSFDARVSARDWIESFQLPFKHCVAAGARSLMCSYNKVNGVPSCANKALLTDLLRGEWRFAGYIVSDCIAIQQVHTTHHFANSLPEAAAMSLRAGTDLDLCGGFTPYLTTAVQTGLVSEAVVDVAVRRLLRARFELGDFDPEHLVGYRRLNHTVADTHHELAREAARQAIVLLENKKETLPLAASQLAGKKVAVLGPCANNTNCQMGDYSPKSDGPIVTPMEAFVARLGAASVLYAPGCPGDAACNGGPCPVSCRCANQSMFAPAAAAAAAADVVIFVGGASGLTEWMEGEAADKRGITWQDGALGEQENLAKAVQAKLRPGVPFIVAMNQGSPLVSAWAFAAADAYLSLGYSGQAGGLALVDVLLTEPEGPSGKLTTTWYKPGQLGDYMSYDMTGSLGPQGKTYKYLTAEPYYRFGAGKSYGSFVYSGLELSPALSADPCAAVVATALVTNSGRHAAAEIAQLYLLGRSPAATVPTPPLKLAGFDKTKRLAPGESAALSFIVTAEHRAVVLDYDHSQAVEPGTFAVAVGGHQPADGPGTLHASFKNTGKGPLRNCGI
jgi:beta-glucosidase